MKHLQKYTATDKMSDLISENCSVLQVMSRFGLSLGVGEKTVREVCDENNVHCNTFLALVNFMSEGFPCIGDELDNISIPSLIDYLRQSHLYFLDYCLPSIRERLLEAIVYSEENVSFLILKFFDDYMQAVRKHMEYEDITVFKYAESLLNGTPADNYQIGTYSKHHDQVGETLTELKNILIKYCPAQSNANMLNLALIDIYTCEEGLEWHSKIEDYLFVPAILNLERRVMNECK